MNGERKNMNPLLPRYFFIPDAEARVMPDGRLYLYGSKDIYGEKDYCSKEYHVFSTDDPRMEQWTDHGVSLSNSRENPGIPFSPDVNLYAPDCVYHKGKYYLYVCGANRFEAVLEADRPEGPYINARPIVGADGDGIDPAVFVDDDGQVYYFWGQFRLKGARLKDDMATLDVDSLKENILTEPEHGFHEGASIRKRDGKYYMVYTDISRGKATCLSYAVSDFPLGPYKKMGVIIDNVYCDPKSWNNHGSIECFCGQWYVFYHRSSGNSNVNRRVCAEPVYFNDDGTINEVKMTSQGASAPISEISRIDASVACRLKGNVYIAPEKNSFGTDVNEVLMNAGNGNWTEDWAEFRYIDFRECVSIWKLRVKGHGSLSLMVEDCGIVASVEINSNEFENITGALYCSLKGCKSVWLLMNGENISIDWFGFE